MRLCKDSEDDSPWKLFRSHPYVLSRVEGTFFTFMSASDTTHTLITLTFFVPIFWRISLCLLFALQFVCLFVRHLVVLFFCLRHRGLSWVVKCVLLVRAIKPHKTLHAYTLKCFPSNTAGTCSTPLFCQEYNGVESDFTIFKTTDDTFCQSVLCVEVCLRDFHHGLIFMNMSRICITHCLFQSLAS